MNKTRYEKWIDRHWYETTAICTNTCAARESSTELDESVRSLPHEKWTGGPDDGSVCNLFLGSVSGVISYDRWLDLVCFKGGMGFGVKRGGDGRKPV